MLSSRPWRPPPDLPRTRPFAIEVVLKVRQNPAPFQNRDSIGNPALQVSLVPPAPRNGSFLPPWCLADCPIDPFLPPSCLHTVQLILSCLPGLPNLSKWFFPASLVPPRSLADCPMSPFLPPWCLASLPNCSFLPPWCLASCPIDPFLPPWCLASCPMSPFLPPWCLSGCPNGPYLPPCQRNSVCAGQPAVAPTPGFAANRAVRH